jgi:hypothetical protein
LNISELKWLAGFFDAEGSVSLQDTPTIAIMNTCPRIAFSIREIFAEMAIVVKTNPREESSKSSKKLRRDIILNDEEHIRIFIEYVGPYIRAKKKQIEILKDCYGGFNINLVEKMKFTNQVNNFIIFHPEKVKAKLRTKELTKFSDIPVLSVGDSTIVIYNWSCWDYSSGLIDAEASFNIDVRDGNKKKFVPEVVFISTNKEVTRRFFSTLYHSGIGCHISFNAPTVTDRYRWRIKVSGIKRVEKLCRCLKNKLKTKDAQAKLILEYCKFRLANRNDENDLGFETYRALKEMRRGKYI